MSKQLQVADVGGCSGCGDGTTLFGFEDRRALLFNEQVSHAAGDRPEQNPAGLASPQARTDDGNAFTLQETLRKQSILTSNIRQARDHPGASEDLRLQPFAPGAARQQSVHQQLHGMNAGAHLLGPAILSRQQEVIHAPDSGYGIAHARCDAAAQKGLQNSGGIVRHQEFTLDNQDPVFLSRCRGCELQTRALT